MAETSEGAKILFRQSINIVYIGNGEKGSPKGSGCYALVTKFHNTGLSIQQLQLTCFFVTGPRFCTPPKVHKNEQLLFFKQFF